MRLLFDYHHPFIVSDERSLLPCFRKVLFTFSPSPYFVIHKFIFIDNNFCYTYFMATVYSIFVTLPTSQKFVIWHKNIIYIYIYIYIYICRRETGPLFIYVKRLWISSFQGLALNMLRIGLWRPVLTTFWPIVGGTPL